jgi:hypothetical protein
MAPIDFELALVLAENGELTESLSLMIQTFDRIGLEWDDIRDVSPSKLSLEQLKVLSRAKRIDPTTPEYDVFIAAMTRTDLQGDPQ